MPALGNRALIIRLRAILSVVDPLPPGLVEVSNGLLALRDLDAELAELLEDSADDREPVGVRGRSEDVRLLSFDTGTVGVELQVLRRGDARRDLEGLVLAAGCQAVILAQSQGQRSVPVDEAGRFWIAGLRPGPLRCTVLSVDGARTVTSWTLV